jgi:quinol monooxygenase YgiN
MSIQHGLPIFTWPHTFRRMRQALRAVVITSLNTGTVVERRELIEAAGTVLAVSPWLSQIAMAQSFASTARETNMAESVKKAGVSPGPGSSSGKLEVHPGWVRSGADNAPGHKAYYINLEAKAGKGDEVEQFLRDILAGVEKEPGTGPWFGCRFSDTTFGIFEAFPDTAARNAHDIGPGGSNFLRSKDLDDMLLYPAHLYRLDSMFGKFSVMFGKTITST